MFPQQIPTIPLWLTALERRLTGKATLIAITAFHRAGSTIFLVKRRPTPSLTASRKQRYERKKGVKAASTLFIIDIALVSQITHIQALAPIKLIQEAAQLVVKF